MRHAVLKPRKSPDTPATPWRIDYRKDGKRRREYFKTNAEAEEALKNLKAKLKREGDESLGLSHDSRIAAMEIEKALLPFKKTLRECCRQASDIPEWHEPDR